MASTFCNTFPNPMLKQAAAFPSSRIMHRTCSFGQLSLPQSKDFSWSQSNKSNFVSPKPSLFNNNNTPSTSSSTTTTSSPNNFQLSRVWRQIQGCDDWEDIIQPLHPLLSQEIIRYGEFVIACYKAFDLNPSSRRYLNCKYGKNTMLSQVGMENSGYFISKYIYATPDIELPLQNGASSPGRWIGYVSVSSDEETKRIGRRDVLITFRGTVTCHEWVANMMSSLAPARLDPHNPRPEVMVESGFLSLYTSDESNSKFGLKSCREQLLSEISRLLSKYKGEEMSISIAGHSMGSSLALLLAYDISELELNRDDKKGEKIPITVFSFAGPRVGNLSFKERLDELGVKVLRIVNVHDPITKLPGFFLNENFRIWGGKYELPWNLSCYAHVGVELALDFFKIQNPSCVHDLENYISLLKCPKRVCGEDHQQQDAPVSFLSMAKELLYCVQTLTCLYG